MVSPPLRFLLRLRRRRYDYSVFAFPSNKVAFHLGAALIGARHRLGFAYPRSPGPRLECLETALIDADPARHDIDQNLNLLTLLGLDPATADRRPAMAVSPSDQEYAAAFWQKHAPVDLERIAIHPGAGGEFARQGWQGAGKRWSVQKFRALAERLAAERPAHILILGGADEAALKAEILVGVAHPERFLVIDEPLLRTAAILAQCSLMISNDSGLMHVAAAMSALSFASQRLVSDNC